MTDPTKIPDAVVERANKAFAETWAELAPYDDIHYECMKAALAAAGLAEALKDAERLNAVERNLWYVEPQYHTTPAVFMVGKAGAMRTAKTVRAAIDAARKGA